MSPPIYPPNNPSPASPYYWHSHTSILLSQAMSLILPYLCSTSSLLVGKALFLFFTEPFSSSCPLTFSSHSFSHGIDFRLVQFRHSVMFESLWPHGLQHTRLPCPSPTPGACSNSCPSSWWCHPTISSSVITFPPAFNLFQHQGLLQWVSSSHQVAKVLEFQLHHQSCQWIFRTDFL